MAQYQQPSKKQLKELQDKIDVVLLNAGLLPESEKRFTRSLSDYFTGIAKANPFNIVADIQLKIIATFAYYYKELSQTLSKKQRVIKAHREIDIAIFNSPNKSQVKCKAKCANCCYYPVSPTHDEADLIADFIKAKKQQIDFNRLESQDGAGVSYSEWIKLPIFKQRCVFLDEENSCSIYEIRPMVCRNHMVSSSSDKCDIRSNADASIVATIKAEVILSAYQTLEKDKPRENMASMMLNRVKQIDLRMTCDKRDVIDNEA